MGETNLNSQAVPVSEREIKVERIFNAPRELVFDAYTQAKHLEQWWIPPGWSIEIRELDFRPGGKWHYCMRSPEGQESWGLTVYQEIDRPNGYVYTDFFADAEGNASDEMPQCVVTMTFIDLGDKTKVMSSAVYPTREDMETVKSMGVEEGINLFMDNLAAHLATLQADRA